MATLQIREACAHVRDGVGGGRSGGFTQRCTRLRGNDFGLVALAAKQIAANGSGEHDGDADDPVHEHTASPGQPAATYSGVSTSRMRRT